MAENVLVMRGICKSFGGVPVLKNVDFTLQKGMIHALVGGNGAGKSTLMKIMSGVYSCDSGSITVNSVTKHITSPNVAREMGIKMIFQELSLVPTLTVPKIFSSTMRRRSAASWTAPRCSARQKSCCTGSAWT